MAYTFDNQVTVTANGYNYSAWESVSVRRTYGNPVATFELTPAEGSYGDNYANLKLQPGDLVNISFGDQPAFYGMVGIREAAYDPHSHQIVIIGRSLTEAAVRGSIPVSQGSYDNYTLEQAASAVLQPLGINFQMQATGQNVDKPFQTLKVQYGESPMEFVTRIAAMRNVFLTDDVNGNIIATSAGGDGSTQGSFVEGVNILYARATMDNMWLADRITVATQQPGSDQNWPQRAIAATGQTTGYGSTGVPSLLISEHPGDATDAQMRANHENTVSQWAMFKVTIGVVGWTNDAGQLWDPTMQSWASVYSPMLFPAGQEFQTLCLQSVTFKQDNATGSTTEIELVPAVQLGGTAGIANTPTPNSTPSAAQPDSPDSTIET